MAGEHISSYFVGVPGGLTMSLIAFSIVSLVIIGLMLVMMALHHICAAIGGMSKPKPAAPAAAPAPAATPAKASAPAAAAAADDDELIAVLSAAVAAACGASARVVAFAPVKAPEATSWKHVGRLQNTEGF